MLRYLDCTSERASPRRPHYSNCFQPEWDFYAMPVVKLSDDVFFRQFIPDLTPNTAKQEVRRRLSPDYDPAARYRAMLDTPEVQAVPRDLWPLRSIVESYEMLH